MTREPEWDDYSRAEAVAAATMRRVVCKHCGLPGGMVHDRKGDRLLTWPGGRKFLVKTYRCLSCASLDRVERKVPGDEAARDGRRRVVEEVHDT